VRPDQAQTHAHDLGRELFAGLRRNVQGAEQGADLLAVTLASSDPET
jgi:hypothetical protein